MLPFSHPSMKERLAQQKAQFESLSETQDLIAINEKLMSETQVIDEAESEEILAETQLPGMKEYQVVIATIPVHYRF